MAGLVPAIHAFAKQRAREDVDARDKPGHDGAVVNLKGGIDIPPFCLSKCSRRDELYQIARCSVIARSVSSEAIQSLLYGFLDCFAVPVLGQREALIRVLAMTI